MVFYSNKGLLAECADVNTFRRLWVYCRHRAAARWLVGGECHASASPSPSDYSGGGGGEFCLAILDNQRAQLPKIRASIIEELDGFR